MMNELSDVLRRLKRDAAKDRPNTPTRREATALLQWGVNALYAHEATAAVDKLVERGWLVVRDDEGRQ